MFYERFLDLCTQKDIAPSAAAKEIGLSNATTTHWSHGTEPSMTSVHKVARYFNVDVNYLLGKDSGNEAPAKYLPLPDDSADKGSTVAFQFDRFYNLCKQQGKKQTYLYELVGMPSKAGSNLRKTKKVKPEILEVWARELHTSAAYLNGETDDPAAPEEQEAAQQQAKEKAPAADSSRGITDEDLKFALFGGGDVTDAQFEEVKNFARFIKERDANGQSK